MPTLHRSLLPLAFLLATLTLANGQTPLRLVNVTPCRLLDTRNTNPIQGGTFATVNLPSLAQSGGAYGSCAPFSLANAQAYSLNVTLVPQNGHPVGYLTIWPTGQSQPLVSLMNSYDGRVKANAAIVPAGTDGAVNVYVTDTTDVLIDIDAYFDSASDSSALAFFPLPPCRLVDTRGGDGGPLQAMVERDYSFAGNCNVPSNAAAYSLNVTVVPTNGVLAYLSVWPQGETQPTVSTLNDPTGTVVANAAIVPAGPDKKTAFWAYNNTHLLVDTNGYFAAANSASNPLSLFNVSPCRVLDTRNGIGRFSGTIPVAVVGSSCGIPGAASEAFVFNATVVPELGELSYLTLWPQGGEMPVVSTLNAYDGAVTSNMAIVPAGEGNNSISAYILPPPDGKAGQLILDISSYFAPVPGLNIQTDALPNGTRSSAYSVSLAALGGVPPYTWFLNSGNLPPGLNISSSGTISGTPTTIGTYDFQAGVQDSEIPTQTAVRALEIVVNAAQGTLAITTTSLPNATVNTPYGTVLTANGGLTPYAWSIVAGSLPPGLSFNSSTGQIFGTPQTAGFFLFNVQVTDAQNHTAMLPLGMVVDSGAAKGTLNGMYAISFTGYGQDRVLVAAGSFTLDGNGNVTGGETDVNNSAGGVEHDIITGGTYSVDSNGLGQVNWTDDHGGNGQVLVATGSAEEMRIIAYNPNGAQGIWGAGVVRQQNPASFNLAALTGSWTFGFQGFQSGNAAGAGLFHQDTSGNLNGQEDVNIGGQESTVQFTGSMTAPDSNGRVTAQLHLGNQVLNYAGYVVSADQGLLTDIDSGHQITITSLRQSGALGNGIFNGKAVGRESRAKNNGMLVSDAFVLLASFDGAGNDSLTIDENFGGTLLLQQMSSGTYSVDPATGRSFVSGNGGGDLCYPVQQNEAFCFDPSAGHPGLLFFQPQATGQQFNNASLNGQYLGGSLPQYVSTTDSTIDALFADGAGNGSVTSSQSGPDGTTLNDTGTGTYSIDSTGRITINGGGSPAAYGYLVGPDRFFAISADSDPRVLIHVRSSAP